MDYINTQENLLSPLYSKFTKSIIMVFFLIGAVYLGNKHFTLYHTGVEIFGTVIGFVMAVISINTYKLNKDNRIIFLGISFGFIAAINLMHLFAYKGIDLDPVFTFNVSIQLWVIARYMQSISLLVSFISHNKRYSLLKVASVFLTILLLLFTSIFYLKIFPDCYVDGLGFTSFKMLAGYINCAISLIVLVYFIRQNKESSNKSNTALKLSMVYSILCELFFIFSTVTFDMSSILAHLFQLLSFYYIYIALVRSSLQEPHFALITLNNKLKTKNKNLKTLVDMFKLECAERERLEIESRQKNQIFNAILESAVDGILVVNNNDLVIHVNRAFISSLCIPFEINSETTNSELINFVKSQLLNPEEFIKQIQIEWATNHEYVKHLYLKNGKILEASSAPFIDNNVICGRVIICRDITERRKVEELQKQIEIKQASIEKAKEFDELRTNFFCTVSHELKTPLNIILGVIQLVSRGSKDDLEHIKRLSSSKYINMMKQNCYRLIKLSNNLIDITKIDAGYTEMNLCNHNIVSVVEDITLSVAEYTNSRDISLVFDTDIEEKIIACDDEQLERVMLNLLSNAIKFTDAKGTIKVDIKDNNDYVVISVTDSGIGIPKDKVDIVFDRFRQVDSTLKRQKEGSGIGLALVKSIIEKHGGKITLESEIGKGSKFIIKLPVKVIDDDKQLHETSEYNDMNVDRINIEFSDIYELNTY